MVLLGIATIVAGFLLRFHPLLVIAASALVTGFAAGIDPLALVAALGKAFNEARYVSVVWVVLPVVGLLEANGLRERAAGLIARMRGATAGRFLTFYMLARQLLAAVGIASVAGHPQTVRPLVAPIAEAAAERQAGDLPDEERDKVRAMAAATDNIGLFFGEDVFMAVGSVLLIKGVLDQYAIDLEPFQLSVWAIPTAIAAALIHAFRLWLLDRRLARGRK